MLYRWILKHSADDNKISEILNHFNISPILASLLVDLSLETKDEIENFFNPQLSQLHDPFKMHNMDIAVNRIIEALRKGENMLVYGDYDVDGTTGVSILYEAIFKLGGKVSFYIPNRITDGYGLSMQGIKTAKERKTDLIITVDCGITAVEEVKFANECGLDVIICDHHEPSDSLPEAVAVLDPKIKECQYPFKELAGVGVAFKLLQALYSKLGYGIEELESYLDLVAVGTAADIVSLRDENRILVKYGLERLNKNPRNGLFALLESSSLLGREINVSLIVFVLAPRINAVGRMSNAKKAVHLLTSSSLQQARNIARILESENKIRRGIDDTTCQEAIKIIEENMDLEKEKIIVLAKNDWHPGVIGIVASRIMEKYNRPSILISLKDGLGKGSARSTLNFDIYEALYSVSDLLENFGGHKFAAGLTICEDNLDQFKEAINRISNEYITEEDLTPKLEIQREISLNDLDANFLKWLKLFAPYGPQNRRPVFLTRNIQIAGNASIVGNNHLKLKVKQDGIVIDAIAYNLGEIKYKLKSANQSIDSAFVIEENTWNGQTTIQMRIKDINIL